MGKIFKGDAKAVNEFLGALPADELKALADKAAAEGKAEVSIGGKTLELPAEVLVCETKTTKEHVEAYTPNVIEPSFGIDRILTAIYEHTFYVRESEEEKAAAEAKAAAAAAGDKKKKKEAEKKESKPGVLGLPAEVAPYKLAVLPLDGRVAAAYGEALTTIREGLSNHGLQYKVDESGASIGRRYARADELGIPFAVTVDFDTMGMGEKVNEELVGTATLRDRDTTEQVRLPLADVPDVVAKLCSASSFCWADLAAAYGAGGAGAAEGAPAMMAYLAQHGVTAKLNAAVNELAKAQPADPMAFLCDLLAKK